MSHRTIPIGAIPGPRGVQFRVWAPNVERITLILEQSTERFEMQMLDDGYFEYFVDHLTPGALYRYELDDGPQFPDPASRFQPEGVHGPSMVIDPSSFVWGDTDWRGIPQEDLVFYEIHVGTFTHEGTFAGVQRQLPYLKDLGVTALELMPIDEFPGNWNWGYDHAALYAPSRAYGNPDSLRALIDAAHETGLAVFLDVIYNHLGPDGAYVAAYAPFFTEKHRTPWGAAINLDDVHCAGVRNFFIDNALHWLNEYHIDGFRLDATHAIKDDNEYHFLAELADAVSEVPGGPRRYVIAEDSRNLNTLVLPKEKGGFGLHGVWVDDFHHQIRNMTAGDTEGYYADFAETTMGELAETIRKLWFYDGKPSRHKNGKIRGTKSEGILPQQCVYAIQNHDQVGNRPLGDRLTDQVSLPVYRAASAILLFLPQLPLLFMGQEWAASTPFQFFTDHNEELGPLVSKGRKKEFRDFTSFAGEVPDPQDPETFLRSRLDWAESEVDNHRHILAMYRDLLGLRKHLVGELEAYSHGPSAIIIRRGIHYLIAAFEAGSCVPLPADTEIIWQTEWEGYDLQPHPVEVRGGNVMFRVAGAVVASAADHSQPFSETMSTS